MTGAIPLREYLASLRAAKPGDRAGGFLEGQSDQLQKLPGAGQGHGGEFVVNAEATRRFRPILEAINRSVPAAKGVKAERPSRGRAYFEGGGVGSEGAGPAGSSASAEDVGVATDTTTDADFGLDDPGAFGLTGTPFGVPAASPYGASVPYGIPTNRGGLAAFGRGATGRSSSTGRAASTVAGILGGPLGAPASAVVGGLVAAAENAIANKAGENANVTGFGVTPGGLAIAGGQIADEVAGIQGLAAPGGVTGGPASGQGQGGADAPEWGWGPGDQPVALSDYLAWLRRTTQPVRGLRESIYG